MKPRVLLRTDDDTMMTRFLAFHGRVFVCSFHCQKCLLWFIAALFLPCSIALFGMAFSAPDIERYGTMVM